MKFNGYLERFKISNPFLVGLFTMTSKRKFGSNNYKEFVLI